MEIKSLAKTDYETIAKACIQAFADYEIQLNVEELKRMWKRRGFCPELSFAAFDGADIAAYTLNGIGMFNGVNMAYDTGTGTLPKYRGQGLATKIFTSSIPFLKAANINHYLLEVLQHNTKAVSIYQKIGFEVTREFYYFMWKKQELSNVNKKVEIPCSIERFEIEKHPYISNFWDFYPSWQNSFEAIQREPEDFVSLGAFTKGKLIGYCVFEPTSGDVTQIAVNKEHRRKGVASLLLDQVGKLNKNEEMKLINSEISSVSIVALLRSKNVDISGKQFEMIKAI